MLSLLRSVRRSGSLLFIGAFGATIACISVHARAQQEVVQSSLFLGPLVDHFLDESGKLGIEAVATEVGGAKFVPADGRVPNYGVQRGGVIWLRVRIPQLDVAAVPEWVLSIDNARLRSLTLYRPEGSGWSVYEWRIDRTPSGASSATRYPALHIAAADLSGRTVFIRAQTVGSLNAPLWLQPAAAFVSSYASQSFWLGVLLGALAGLLLYFVAIGVSTRDSALLTLCLFTAIYLVWVAAFYGLIETVIAPGAATLSRVVELSGIYLVLACTLAYSVIFLRIPEKFPRGAHAVWALLAVLVLLALEIGYAQATNIIRLPPLLPYFAVLTLLIVACLPFLVIREHPRRSIAFLLCWIPILVSAIARFALELYPTMGANPLVVNAGPFAVVATLALLATVTSLDLQNRERDLRAVQQKSHRLEIADKYKSHFLASASHDLRQPLHALNLFVAQLQTEADPAERSRLIGRVESAVGSMNELFGALLDMTKLDAGILQPNFTELALARLFKRIETTFTEAARAKGVHLRVVPTKAWIKSDPILLERILLNLVSNAVRYTMRGGIVVGCRRGGGSLRIDVCDTGPGIPEDQQGRIFAEFYQSEASEADRSGSLGLGLTIVDRLGQLLGHPIELKSREGRGSRFSITVPLAAEQPAVEASAAGLLIADPARGKLVVVIDDDPLVLEGMGGVLRSWGCKVVGGDTPEAVLSQLDRRAHPPDLIISDYRLANAKTGIGAIEQVRAATGAEIPAFLISGDTAPERLRDASAHGLQLLHKPVPPMRLRAMLNQMLRARPMAVTAPAAE
jgi:signal transduction histidine kinase/CheY-like chemotaxis protein